MPTLVKMPKWGLTMTAGTVTDWIASEGEEVSAGAPLLTVETEKAVNDVEAPADGILRKIVAATGSEVPVSGPVAIIAAPDETLSDEDIIALLTAAAPKAAATGPAVAGRPARESRAASRDDSGRVNASPAARKLARELDVDLAAIEATGPGGRITSDDVQRAAASSAPGESDAAGIEERQIPLGDGRDLFAILAGPTDATPPLVFLHGLGGSQATWMTLLADLVDRYRVAALDLPGHGQSDKPDPAAADYSVAGLTTTVIQGIEALGLEPVVLVGHSLGGAIAMRIALERPAIVRGLVLVDSAGVGDEINPELLDRVEAEPSKDEARRLLELFFENKRWVLERGVEEMYRARSSPGADAAMRAAAAASFSREGQRIGLAGRMGDISLPTLVVWGERDRVIPATQAETAASAIPGAWLEIIEGVGHVPQVEASAELARLLDRFLRALLPPA
jgi:pimeloyl-ACP methyl ester carboxylesterase